MRVSLYYILGLSIVFFFLSHSFHFSAVTSHLATSCCHIALWGFERTFPNSWTIKTTYECILMYIHAFVCSVQLVFPHRVSLCHPHVPGYEIFFPVPSMCVNNVYFYYSDCTQYTHYLHTKHIQISHDTHTQIAQTHSYTFYFMLFKSCQYLVV